MKVSKIMRWLGPAAIAAAVFAVISDQLGLITHLPEITSDATGYHAVGSGLFLLVLTLLLVGMVRLYVHPNPAGPKVVEYGDALSRYILLEELEEDSHQVGRTRVPRRPPFAVRDAPAAARRRPVHRSQGRGAVGDP